MESYALRALYSVVYFAPCLATPCPKSHASPKPQPLTPVGGPLNLGIPNHRIGFIEVNQDQRKGFIRGKKWEFGFPVLICSSAEKDIKVGPQ